MIVLMIENYSRDLGESPNWFSHPDITWASLLLAMWSSQSTAQPELITSSANLQGLIKESFKQINLIELIQRDVVLIAWVMVVLS